MIWCKNQEGKSYFLRLSLKINTKKFFDSTLNTGSASSNIIFTSENKSDENSLLLPDSSPDPLNSEPAQIEQPVISMNKISIELEANDSSDSSDEDNSITELYSSQGMVDSIPVQDSSQNSESTQLPIFRIFLQNYFLVETEAFKRNGTKNSLGFRTFKIKT